MNTGTKKSEIYRKFSDFLLDTIGDRAYRVTVDGGFSCPNRDITKHNAPCLFCDEKGSGARHNRPSLSIKEQYLWGRERIAKKMKMDKFIPYFQSFTNTYDTFENCVQKYEQVLDEKAVGIAIGTRPDCLEDKLINWLGELSKEKLVILDLGVQSLTDRVLNIIKRGHKVETTYKTLEKLEKYPKIHTVAHLIFGLPTESEEEMMQGTKLFNNFNVKGLKLHQLNVLKNTGMEKLYREGKFKPIEFDVYVKLGANFLERIPSDVVIHRLSARADSHPDLIAPEWGKYHHKAAQKIKELLIERSSYQGKLAGKNV